MKYHSGRLAGRSGPLNAAQRLHHNRGYEDLAIRLNSLGDRIPALHEYQTFNAIIL